MCVWVGAENERERVKRKIVSVTVGTVIKPDHVTGERLEKEADLETDYEEFSDVNGIKFLFFYLCGSVSELAFSSVP